MLFHPGWGPCRRIDESYGRGEAKQARLHNNAPDGPSYLLRRLLRARGAGGFFVRNIDTSWATATISFARSETIDSHSMLRLVASKQYLDDGRTPPLQRVGTRSTPFAGGENAKAARFRRPVTGGLQS